MTNKDFALAITKFFFYSNNYANVTITYPSLFNGEQKKYLPSFFNAFDKNDIEHLLGKFEYRYEKAHGYSASAIIEFFADLDGNNRAKMLKWINENYEHSGSGIDLNMLEDDIA